MNREGCLEAGINYDTGVNRFAGNAEMFEKFLVKFPADPTFPDLKSSIAGDDAEQAFRLAHTLKGVTGNLSMDELLKNLNPVVEALRGGDIASARELFPPVETSYNKVVKYING